jgi:hypothetical protein
MSEATANENEIAVPRAQFGLFWIIISYTIVITATSVAILNLMQVNSMPAITLVCSVIWLILVALIMRSEIAASGGWHQYVINRRGDFSLQRFMWIQMGEDGQSIVSLGYRIRGKSYYFMKIPLQDLISIGWSMGQASGMTGRDQNDWSVYIQYLPNRLVPPNATQWSTGCVIGPHRSKNRTEVFGRELVQFLENAGVAFCDVKEGRQFVQHGREEEHHRLSPWIYSQSVRRVSQKGDV